MPQPPRGPLPAAVRAAGLLPHTRGEAAAAEGHQRLRVPAFVRAEGRAQVGGDVTLRLMRQLAEPTPERVLESRRLYEGQVVNLRLHTLELAGGRRATREVGEHADVVAI